MVRLSQADPGRVVSGEAEEAAAPPRAGMAGVAGAGTNSSSGIGGFGGGGGGMKINAAGTAGGFGAGAGGHGAGTTGNIGGGGGGLGAGGAIFVRQGASLTLTDGGISGGTVIGGAGGAKTGTGTAGTAGQGIGQAIFLAGRANYSVSGSNTVTISDSLGGGTAFGGNFNISSATESGSTVTITTSANHDYLLNQRVTVTGVGVAGYNGTFLITAVTANTFTY